jgi:hypothetical protein
VEFVIASESAVQTISRFPLDLSESKNSLNVFDNALGAMSIQHSGNKVKRTDEHGSLLLELNDDGGWSLNQD